MVRTIEARRRLTRRNFLVLSGLAATGVVATACGGDALPGQTPTAPSPPAQATGAAVQPTATTPAVAPTAGMAQTAAPAQPTAAGAQPTSAGTAAPRAYQEAPQLAQLVKDGKLPPVAERLPKAPLVLKPLEQVGKHGGTWRAGLLGGADPLAGADDRLRAPGALGPGVEADHPERRRRVRGQPGREGLHLRAARGVKWSDGQPFTADDILFWYEDVFNNKELTSSRGVNPPTVEKVDQATVRFVFAEPNGLFLQDLAASGGNTYTRYPAHYLKPFHKKYNTTTLDQLVQQNNAKDWVELFRQKGGRSPARPTTRSGRTRTCRRCTPGGLSSPTGRSRGWWPSATPSTSRWTARATSCRTSIASPTTWPRTRRPSSSRRSTARSTCRIATSPPTRTSQSWPTTSRRGYRFFETVPSQMNTLIIHLNLTHKDPAKRQLFQNKDFRIGLSHAIDRQEIIDVVYVGQGVPWQGAPQRDTAFYNERLAKQYTEFDARKAAEHLDKVAPQKDGQGFRLGPDGARLSFVVEVSASAPDQVDAMNLIKGHWQRAGVEIQVKVEDRALLYTRKDANEHDAVVWLGGGGLDAIQDPRSFFPVSSESNYAEAWYVWFQKPSNPRTAPEEPPAPTKQQMDLYRQIEATADLSKQHDLMKQILAIAADQFYVIGVSSLANGYGIAKNTLRNVPAKMFSTGGQWPNPAPTNTSLYFYQ